MKNKVGYYFRKSYRDFDKPGTSTQIGIITSMGEFDTSLGGVSNSRITNVTFGSRMRNLHDGSQPSIKLYDKVGNVDAITLWDMGTATDNVGTADYQYHCESGFQVKTDDSTGRNGMSFHYTSDCRHLGDESMM